MTYKLTRLFNINTVQYKQIQAQDKLKCIHSEFLSKIQEEILNKSHKQTKQSHKWKKKDKTTHITKMKFLVTQKDICTQPY